ncbi:pentatricopeptide repeat-containing protein At5g59600 [Ananas comosus]|nr:pentatricopeptide repeat-containing protein At5g59600 [Ananas comosus]
MSGSSNVSRWIALIAKSSRQGFYKETLRLFHQMQSEGFGPHPFVLPNILKACAHLSDLRTGRLLHCLAVRHSLHCDAFVISALIDMYSKCSRLRLARQVFDEMAERDLVVWNSIISGYAHQGFPYHAMVLFVKVRFFGIEPDLVTWNALISGFSRLACDRFALELFRAMQIDGIKPDVVTWTSIICGLVLNFSYDKARGMFREMIVGARISPTAVTVSSLLPACANVADVRHGKEIHGYAVVLGVEEDMSVSSSLIDMYSKCGLILEAKRVFEKMGIRSTVTWNSMIFGLANSGHCHDAMSLFHRMHNEGVRADHLTFTAVFTACSHAGMVEIGRSLFRSMQEEYGIKPRLEHYACMVDLLGRAGKILEANNLIEEMPTKPDRFVWGALLGACRNHGNIELAEVAASRLLELEPESAAGCALLSNLLADAGREKDAIKLKKLMKRRRLRFSGCSWMQVA